MGHGRREKIIKKARIGARKNRILEFPAEHVQ
jgi:hypothetical protein